MLKIRFDSILDIFKRKKKTVQVNYTCQPRIKIVANPAPCPEIKPPKRPTDESKQRYKLTIHEKGIGWFISKAKAEGIYLERTYDNDSSGDIFCPDPDNVARVQELVDNIKHGKSA